MSKNINNDVSLQPYTKEWFVKNCSKEQLEKLEVLNKNNNSYDVPLSRSVFEGSVDKIEDRMHTNRGMSFAQKNLIESIGIENLVEILDADKDGNITKEEIDNVSVMSDDEFQEKENSYFSAKDFQVIYENAMNAKDCIVKNGNFEDIYIYPDGSKTTIRKDLNGNVLSKNEVKPLENGGKVISDFIYADEKKIKSNYDENGRFLGVEILTKNVEKNKSLSIKRNQNGNIDVEEKTVGKSITTSYSQQKEILNKKLEVHYNSDNTVGNTRQRDIGECWVLSGVNALRDTKEGAKIIKDSITHNDDGSITVKLKGLKKSYTYSAEQIVAGKYNNDKNQKFASGDDADMRVLELAFADYRRSIIPSFGNKIMEKLDMPTKKDPLNGGYMAEALFVLTGVVPKVGRIQSSKDKLLEQKMNNPESIALDVDFKKDDKEIKDGTITDGHAYSIKRVTKDTVYVVNPWDSSKEIAYPRDRFLKMSGFVSGVDLSKVKN